MSDELGKLAGLFREPGGAHDGPIGIAQRAIEVFLANLEAENPPLKKAWDYFSDQMYHLMDEGNTLPGIIDNERQRLAFLDQYTESDILGKDETPILNNVYDFVVSQDEFSSISPDDLRNVRTKILSIFSDPALDKKT